MGDEATRLASELSTLLDEVVFTLEHGLPVAIVESLADVGRKLEELVASRIPGDDVADFCDAVEAVRTLAPDSVDRVLRSGEQIVSALQAA